MEAAAAALPSAVLLVPGQRWRPRWTPTTEATASPIPSTTTPAKGATSSATLRGGGAPAPAAAAAAVAAAVAAGGRGGSPGRASASQRGSAQPSSR